MLVLSLPIRECSCSDENRYTWPQNLMEKQLEPYCGNLVIFRQKKNILNILSCTRKHIDKIFIAKHLKYYFTFPLVEKHALNIVNNRWSIKKTLYLETSDSKSFNLYLNNVYFLLQHIKFDSYGSLRQLFFCMGI
jgi:hypothetical protein